MVTDFLRVTLNYKNKNKWYLRNHVLFCNTLINIKFLINYTRDIFFKEFRK